MELYLHSPYVFVARVGTTLPLEIQVFWRVTLWRHVNSYLIYQSARRPIAENLIVHQNCFQNLESRTFTFASNQLAWRKGKGKGKGDRCANLKSKFYSVYSMHYDELKNSCQSNSPEIESRWRRNFPHPFRPALGPIQPPIQRVPGLFLGGKATGAWRWPPTPHLAPRLKEE